MLIFFATFAALLHQHYRIVPLRALLSILLSAVVLLPSLQNFWVRISFEVNKSYIAKNLCENRFKPELDCGGQCYLMKQLAERKKQQEESPIKATEAFFVAPFVEALPTFVFRPSAMLARVLHTPKQVNLGGQEAVLDLLRPPRQS